MSKVLSEHHGNTNKALHVVSEHLPAHEHRRVTGALRVVMIPCRSTFEVEGDLLFAELNVSHAGRQQAAVASSTVRPAACARGQPAAVHHHLCEPSPATPPAPLPTPCNMRHTHLNPPQPSSSRLQPCMCCRFRSFQLIFVPRCRCQWLDCPQVRLFDHVGPCCTPRLGALHLGLGIQGVPSATIAFMKEAQPILLDPIILYEQAFWPFAVAMTHILQCWQSDVGR